MCVIRKINEVHIIQSITHWKSFGFEPVFRGMRKNDFFRFEEFLLEWNKFWLFNHDCREIMSLKPKDGLMFFILVLFVSKNNVRSLQKCPTIIETLVIYRQYQAEGAPTFWWSGMWSGSSQFWEKMCHFSFHLPPLFGGRWSGKSPTTILWIIVIWSVR